MAIIAVLVALFLSIAQLAQDKGARSRAAAEIAAITAACESYKADNGIYPQTGNTDALDPNASGSFDLSQSAAASAYQSASADLYAALSGTGAATRQYFAFKPNMLNSAGSAIVDPYGKYPYVHYYGYSTKHSNNPTFDLWSTANKQIKTVSGQVKWVKNW